MYDVEVVIRRSTYPLRVTHVYAESRVREIIESALAAWGIPFPDSLRDGSSFAERLAESGEYLEHAMNDAAVTVKRTE